MSRLSHIIGRAKRRRISNAILAGAGYGLVISAFVAIAVLVAARLFGYDPPVAAYAAVMLVGMMLGAIVTLPNLPRAFDIALSIDRTLQFRDRLATAFALDVSLRSKLTPASQGRHDAEFASIVRREGERLADAISVKSLAPVNVGGSWIAGALLTVALALGVLYMPVASGSGFEPEHSSIAAAEQVAEERERLRTSIDEAKRELLEENIDDPAVREELDALERLAEQLAGAGDPADVERARDESAARLNELADRLAEQARRDVEAADRLAQRFAGIEPPPERPMSAEEFDEALQRGDFAAAGEALDDRLRERDQMTAEERQELANHLRQTADQVEEIAAEGDPELEEREAQLEQLLRDHGLDEELMRRLLEGDEQAQREAMQRLNEFLQDEENAQRMQDELERLREDRELMEQLERDLEAIHEAMRQSADDLDPPTPSDTAQDEQLDSEREGPTQEQQQAVPPDEQTPRADDDEQPEPEPGQEQPERERDQQEREQRTADQQSEQTEEAVGEAASQDEQSPQDGDSAPQPEQTPQQQDAAGPGDRDQTEREAEQQRSPAEVMREIQERRSAAERRRNASERARERARQLMDPPPSPLDRDLQRELQRQMSPDSTREAGAGHDRGVDRPDVTQPDARDDVDIHDVDARAIDDDPGEVIAEWFNDEDVEIDPETRRAQFEERARSAQRVAERAVEDAAVPARYHEFVRRYFGRLAEKQEPD